MNTSALYGQSLALLTDLYQLTMAYGYWKAGQARREAAFHLFFRKQPFGSGLSIACGLSAAIDFIRNLRYDDSDLAYLETLTGADGKPLFEPAFLDHLSELRFSGNIEAVPEGTAVFPREPLVRVTAPLLECQLLETPLLTIVNFATLIATKAARLYLAAGGGSIVEFGLRRAQGIDGGVTAARAACVGGCVSTSNVLAGKLFGMPVMGTHAHSWVMSFPSELESFDAYAGALPNNCVFLVDTYDTLQGVRNAVQVGRRLREAGHEMVGIRLDSGDMTALSIESRKILDQGGFPDAKIVASSDLDEYKIQEMLAGGARIDVWGVGTRLATAYDQPALGGVYKLAAVRNDRGEWEYKVKTSEEKVKATIPGVQQVRRFSQDGKFIGDVVYDEPHGLVGEGVSVTDGRTRWSPPADAQAEDLAVPIFRQGALVYDPPAIETARERTLEQLASLPEGTKKLKNPTTYGVYLDRWLHDEKGRLIDEVNQEVEAQRNK